MDKQERGKRSKKIGEQHQRKTGDDIEGVYVIDTDAVRAKHGLWDGIEAIIQAYVRLNPLEVQETVIDNMAAKNATYNQFGTGQTKAMRHALSLPPGLMFKLEAYEPTLFTNKKTLHQFMQRYEGFRTCKTV